MPLKRMSVTSRSIVDLAKPDTRTRLWQCIHCPLHLASRRHDNSGLSSSNAVVPALFYQRNLKRVAPGADPISPLDLEPPLHRSRKVLAQTVFRGLTPSFITEQHDAGFDVPGLPCPQKMIRDGQRRNIGQIWCGGRHAFRFGFRSCRNRHGQQKADDETKGEGAQKQLLGVFLSLASSDEVDGSGEGTSQSAIGSPHGCDAGNSVGKSSRPCSRT